MSTPKQIDLSKCKVGQRVRLRDGKVVIFGGESTSAQYPFKYDHPNFGEVTTRQCGRSIIFTENSEDIVAILPPAKKAAKKPAKKGATNKQWEAGKAKILRILDELEGLLKP